MAIETGSVIYNAIKRYYQMGFYDENDMLDFVKWGTLTKEQYAAITGKVYPDPAADTPIEEPTTEEPAAEEPTTDPEEPPAEEPPTDGNATS